MNVRNVMTIQRVKGFLVAAIAFTSGVTPAAAASGPYRFHSPSGHFDLVVETLPDDWTHAHKAKPGMVKEMRDQYAIYFYVAGSSEPINVLYYSDLNPPPGPEAIIQSMLWSPQEEYVVIPDKQKAREGNHMFQLAAPMNKNKVWSLEADHVHWIDGHRFVGDLNTKDVAGAIMAFDGAAGKAELVIPPDPGTGYQIAAVAGAHVTVKEFLNHLDTGKTTWEEFIPACFDLDIDTLKKRSVACPVAP